MLVADKLGFPVEWSLAGAMLTKKQLAPAVEFEQNRASADRRSLRRARPGTAAGRRAGDRGGNREPGRGHGGRRPGQCPVPRPGPARHLRSHRSPVPGAGPCPGRRVRRPRQLRAGPTPRAGAAAARVRARRTVVERRLPATDPRPVPVGGDAARQLRGRHPDRPLSRRTAPGRPGGPCGSTCTTGWRSCSSPASSPSPPNQAPARAC